MTLKRSGITALAAVAALGLSGIAAPAAWADEAEQATWARQGFMNLVQWESEPLFAMAKGDAPYDAEAAKTHASNLKLLYQYPYTGLFLPGTSKADRSGKTRALPDIWQDRAKFEQAFQAAQAAVSALADQAGKGQPEMAAAVVELGKACGGCHKPFRAKDY